MEPNALIVADLVTFTEGPLKGTLMQIWKSPYMLVFL